MTTIAQTLHLILTKTRAKKQGAGWQGHCPAHKDKSPSLSIDQGADTRILLKCHTGCDIDSICLALGITQADLFPPKQKQTKQATQGKPKYNLDKVYDYKDESGGLLFQAVRQRLVDPAKFPNEPRKQFRQRRPDGKGGWVWNLQGVRRVLYGLPELIAADPDAIVWIVEGEKDVDRLRSLGLIATCNPMGAGNWLDEYSDSLIDRDVIIIPDNDPQAVAPDGSLRFHPDGRPVLPGQDHAQQVAASLYSKAKSVKLFPLPNLPDKGDVSDWLNIAGNDLQVLLRLAETVQPLMAPPDAPALTNNNNNSHHTIKAVCLADVQIEQVDWLWEGRIPIKLITILEGIEGVGKSTLLSAIAAAVTCGKGLPDMHANNPANVLWLSAEDDLGMMLKPRLLASGADVSKVFAIGDPFTINDASVALLRQEATKYKPRLVIVDPIFAYTSGDPNKGGDARIVTNELKKFAEEFRCALVLVRHVGKSKGFGDPRAAGMYSIEWRAAARSVLLAGCDPDNPQKRALTQTKNNLGPMADSIGFEINPDPSSPSLARFFWSGVSDLTARRILETIANDDDTLQRIDTEEFLKQVLAGGEMPAKDVQREGESCGISKRTLDRAKSRLRIKSRKITGQGPWLWSLPKSDQGCQLEEDGILGQTADTKELEDENRPRMPTGNLAPARARARGGRMPSGILGGFPQDKQQTENEIDQECHDDEIGILGSNQIAFLITKKQREKLHGLGYSQSDIDKMTPNSAQRILADQDKSVTPK